MSTGNSLRLLLPKSVRTLPFDLTIVIGITLLTLCVTLVPGLRATPLRIPVALTFVLFTPGYAVVAALFPEARTLDERSNSTTREERGGIDGAERAVLSFGMSVTTIPIVGLVLYFTSVGIRLVPTVTSLCGFTLLATTVAVSRRQKLPENDRFRVPYRSWVATLRTSVHKPDSRGTNILNVLLVISIILAVASVTYGVAIPQKGEPFSAVYYLTENENGDLVGDDPPTNFVAGDGRELVVGVDNHEYERRSYTVVVVEQNITIQNNETVVDEQRELDRFETELEHGETWMHTHEVAPTIVDDQVRIAWLLYVDEEPVETTLEKAAYSAELQITVVQ